MAAALEPSKFREVIRKQLEYVQRKGMKSDVVNYIAGLLNSYEPTWFDGQQTLSLVVGDR